MTITEMLGQSGLLTLLGMGVVFSFIIILICCMKLLQVLVHAFKLDKSSENVKSTGTKIESSGNSKASSVDVNAVVAAIACAIRERENS